MHKFLIACTAAFYFIAVLIKMKLKIVLPGLHEKIRMDGSMCICMAHLQISGYQHGYLLANDIDTSIQAVSYLFQHETKRDWQFFRDAAKKFLWNKLDREYKDEINGIVEGLQAQHKNYDSLDITAYNALEELGFYYVPMMDNLAKPGSGNNKAPVIAVHS
jgi:hypothetical protein